MGVGRIVAPLVILTAVVAGPARLQAAPPEAVVVESGPGWRLVDRTPGIEGGYVWETTRSFVDLTPLSDTQRQFVADALAMDTEDPEGTAYIDQDVLNEMENASSGSGGFQASAFGLSCGWQRHEKNLDRDFDFSNLDHDFSFSRPIEGRLHINLPVSGHVTAILSYKQFECGLRTPLIKSVEARASGNARIVGDGSLEANATVQATLEQNWKVAEPVLAEVWVSAFKFVFSLPVHVGVLLDARGTATLAVQLDAGASGTFNYSCRLGGSCSGSSDFANSFTFRGPVASAEVELKAQAYAKAMLRVSLYRSAVAYIEGGVKAYAEAGIWGYYGNGCGDADGDGTGETVRALVADLKAGYKFAYGGDTFFTSDRTIYTGGREWLHDWRDLLGAGGSTALQPMLLGPSFVRQGTPAEYAVRMRPCYPYGDRVNFTLAPGTWTGETSVKPGSTGALVQTTFAGSGPVGLTVTATTDSAGRNLGFAFSRTVNVTPAAPTAPSALQATAQGPTSVWLTWADNSTNETDFELQRRLPGGAWTTVLTPGANATQATDTSAAPATTYEYQIRARAGGYLSAFSNTAAATTLSTLPAAPSSLVAWLDATRIIRLAWTDNSFDETGFTAEFSYSGSAWMGFCNVAPNVTGCTSGANPPVGPYQFRVRATSGAGGSGYSNTAYLTVTSPVTPTTSIAWIQPAESSWGPAGTLTAAGYAQNGSGGVQLVWRERGNDGLWGPWTATAYQAPPDANGTWSNTIASGNPTNRCHWFEAYTNYSGVSSAIFRYTGAPDCPAPSASIAWIQPAELSWGPSGTMTAAGYAANGVGGVQLVWRELVDGAWGPWNVVAWQPVPSANTGWSNTIPSGNRCNWFDAYVNYSGVSSQVYHYTGQNCR